MLLVRFIVYVRAGNCNQSVFSKKRYPYATEKTLHFHVLNQMSGRFLGMVHLPFQIGSERNKICCDCSRHVCLIRTKL